jgi:tight adherence protein C
MSDLYLPLALLFSFGAILSLGVWVRVSARSRRPVEVLQHHLQSAGIDVHQEAMQRPFSERVLEPAVSGLAALARRLTPAGSRDRIAQKLVLAGSPEGWDAERVLAFKGLGLVLGAGTGLAVANMASVSGPLRFGVAAFGALFLFLIPGAVLGQAMIRRQDGIRRSLADTMDLLTISVEAGLGFDAALLHVRRNVDGPLSEEIGRLLHEMQLGVSRADAFRHMGERTNVEELKGFIIAMVQADTFGVSVANVLRAQATEMRTKRRQRAEERAMKIPVKLLFPMLFCILPAMFVVLVGPGVIRIVDTLFGEGGPL